MENKARPLFGMEFFDGSRFKLPTRWEDVFVDYFGEGESGHAHLAERNRYIVPKYIEHRAWPSKFDGITMQEVTDDCRYDEPEFYMESWRTMHLNLPRNDGTCGHFATGLTNDHLCFGALRYPTDFTGKIET